MLRILIGTKNWRTKNHPWWFCRNWTTVWTLQTGPLEIWYHKKRRANHGLSNSLRLQ